MRMRSILFFVVFTLALMVCVQGRTQAARPSANPTGGLTLTVNSSAGQHPISPNIYGINFAPANLAADLDLPVNRWGGNATSLYNWQLDARNLGSDWYFENYPNENSNPSILPYGSDSDEFVQQNLSTGTESLLTIPMTGWAAKSREVLCAFDRDIYPSQQAFDPWYTDCGNGRYPDGSYITGNDPNDASLPVDETFVQGWMTHLISQYGVAGNGGVEFYALDNEPMLWDYTHRDVHPEPTSYDEMRDLTYTYGAAIKASDPTAKILGPTTYGYTAYFYSALDWSTDEWWLNPIDRLAHGDVPFTEWYLQQMQAYEQQHGVRILDYLDLHYYPEAEGIALEPAGNAATQALRLRSTRSLWDPTYIDESWIGDIGDPPIQLIPRMHTWVNSRYPGTKLAISEYNWGALDHINGALAQADVLGIYGREQLDLATLWAGPDFDDPGAFAFRMYRNYDGQGRKFGDTSVNASSSDQEQLSIYAARRSSDGALTIVVINKSGGDQTADVNISGFPVGGSAQVFRYSPANLNQIMHLSSQPVGGSGFTATFPTNSITLFVIPFAFTPTDFVYLPVVVK